MKKTISLLLSVLFLGFSPLHANNVPAQITKSIVKSGTQQAVAQATLRTEVEQAVLSQVTQNTLGVSQSALSTSQSALGASEIVLPQQVSSAAETASAALANPSLAELSDQQVRFFQQAKIFLRKHDRFARDPATHEALERLRAADRLDQLQEIAKLSDVYPKLKKKSVDGLFAKFKYVGPDLSHTRLIKAEDFTYMLEGAIKPPLIESVLENHPEAELERQNLKGLTVQVLWVRSGKARDLRRTVKDIIWKLQADGYNLRLGVHEVADFARNTKIHLHFEKFDEKGVFYNYIMHIDFSNIHLPYSTISYGERMTVQQAIDQSDLISTYGYNKVNETQDLILDVISETVPLEKDSEAYKRLMQTILM